MEFTDTEGKVRCETTRPLGKGDTHLYYRLLPSNAVDEETGAAVDWEVNAWVSAALRPTARGFRWLMFMLGLSWPCSRRTF